MKNICDRLDNISSEQERTNNNDESITASVREEVAKFEPNIQKFVADEITKQIKALENKIDGMLVTTSIQQIDKKFDDQLNNDKQTEK